MFDTRVRTHGNVGIGAQLCPISSYASYRRVFAFAQPQIHHTVGCGHSLPAVLPALPPAALSSCAPVPDCSQEVEAGLIVHISNGHYLQLQQLPLDHLAWKVELTMNDVETLEIGKQLHAHPRIVCRR